MGVARALILVGLGVTLLGVVLLFYPKAFAWFGHLPGDIRVERPGVRVYLPLTSALVVSALLSRA
jgi:hypothetical protein